MKAHIIPVAYLKAFSDDPTKGKKGNIEFLKRNREIDKTTIKKVCVEKDYYTANEVEDHILFKEQENELPKFVNAKTVPDNKTHLIWQLKMRSKIILDKTPHKKELAKLKFDLGKREEIFIDTPKDEFITCDNPLLVFSASHGANHMSQAGFILPISPRRILVSVPIAEFDIAKTPIKTEDIYFINRLICENAVDYVFAKPGSNLLQGLSHFYSPATPLNSGLSSNLGKPVAIINYISHLVWPTFLIKKRS